MRIRYCISDVCSSDLAAPGPVPLISRKANCCFDTHNHRQNAIKGYLDVTTEHRLLPQRLCPSLPDKQCLACASTFRSSEPPSMPQACLTAWHLLSQCRKKTMTCKSRPGTKYTHKKIGKEHV